MGDSSPDRRNRWEGPVVETHKDAFSPEPQSKSPALVDNADRLARIAYRFNSYRRIALHMLRNGVPFYDIVRTQFPRVAPDPYRPVMVTLEFTNYCNMSCVYCSSRLGLRERGFMSEQTFAKAAEGIARMGVSRVRVVGGGEPTLHPRFDRFIPELAQVTRYLSVLSNGQWRNPGSVVSTMLSAPVRMIEVSVEGTEKERYEGSSQRGSFERLLANLALLKEERDRRKARVLINLRIMVRPSDRGREGRLKSFWKKYCDTVMLQRLVEVKTLDRVDDLFKPAQFVDESYPVCSIPFKEIGINWNGDVPLCFNSLAQYGPPGYIVGNVNTDNLGDIWNGEVLKQYRRAHRKRIKELMPICKGCSGV